MSTISTATHSGWLIRGLGRNARLGRTGATCLFLFAALFLLQGCSGSTAQTGTSARSDAEAEHEGDHDDHGHDEHDHGHHDPEHKPKTFPEAVEKLRELRPDLSERIQPGSEDWEIALDIVGWLPELAAESELNEREWNRVESSAGELLEVLRLGSRDAAAWKRFDAALAGLNESVGDYRAAEARFMRPMREAEGEPTEGGK